MFGQRRICYMHCSTRRSSSGREYFVIARIAKHIYTRRDVDDDDDVLGGIGASVTVRFGYMLNTDLPYNTCSQLISYLSHSLTNIHIHNF